MASKNGNEKTAAQVCEERLGDIGALLDQIGQELNGRFRPIEDAGAGWGDVGDLGRVREALLEALQIVSPFSQAEIEATLEELREQREGQA